MRQDETQTEVNRNIRFVPAKLSHDSEVQVYLRVVRWRDLYSIRLLPHRELFACGY